MPRNHRWLAWMVLCCTISSLRGDAKEASHGASSRSHANEPSLPTANARFNTYFHLVCDRCHRRGEACGCEEGVRSGIFRQLFQYTTMYNEWSAQQTNSSAMANVKWLIVDVCCGVGNHLLMNVRGLMLALRLRRAIVFLEESDLHYDMSSVIPIIPMAVPRALGWPSTSTHVISTDHRDGHLGARWMTCGDWDATDTYQFVQIQGLSDVHLPMLHPIHGPWMREHLGDKPFFHLSHYLWTGLSDQEQDFPVRTSSWPHSARYNGV